MTLQNFTIISYSLLLSLYLVTQVPYRIFGIYKISAFTELIGIVVAVILVYQGQYYKPDLVEHYIDYY